MPDNTLILEALDIQDAANWRWRLTAPGGAFLADHAVNLDKECWQYQAMVDLYGHLRRHADPDRRTEAEAAMLAGLGAWLGTEVLGPVADQLVKHAPVTVRVRIPNDPVAAGLFALPLELAHAGGKPLAVQDVSLVFEAGLPAGQALAANDRLRILAVFSLPQGGQSLNLRQERYQLKQLLTSLAARRGGAVDLRVLQYGVTRQMLKELLEEGDGWDVLHFSGHGLATELVLEHADGTPDRIPSEQWVALLQPLKGRLHWVTLSACLSAAVTVEETRRWLGLDPLRADAADIADARPLPSLARRVAERLYYFSGPGRRLPDTV